MWWFLITLHFWKVFYTLSKLSHIHTTNTSFKYMHGLCDIMLVYARPFSVFISLSRFCTLSHCSLIAYTFAAFAAIVAIILLCHLINWIFKLAVRWKWLVGFRVTLTYISHFDIARGIATGQTRTISISKCSSDSFQLTGSKSVSASLSSNLIFRRIWRFYAILRRLSHFSQSDFISVVIFEINYHLTFVKTFSIYANFFAEFAKTILIFVYLTISI